MRTHHTWIRVGYACIRRVIAIAITVILLVHPLLAADSWSRVKKLKKGSQVYVRLVEGKTMTGEFLQADSSSVTVRMINQGAIEVERDHVIQVSVKQSGRHWYAIPLAAAAGAAGGYGGYAIADRTTCSDSRADCTNAKGIIISFSAIGAAVATFKLTSGKPGWRIIYRTDDR